MRGDDKYNYLEKGIHKKGLAGEHTRTLRNTAAFVGIARKSAGVIPLYSPAIPSVSTISLRAPIKPLGMATDPDAALPLGICKVCITLFAVSKG